MRALTTVESKSRGRDKCVNMAHLASIHEVNIRLICPEWNLSTSTYFIFGYHHAFFGILLSQIYETK